MFLAYLKSDYLRTRRLPIRRAHILVPAVTAALFLIYDFFAAGDRVLKISIYFQILGMALPFLSGLFCSMAAEQEQTAGSFQTMLMVSQKRQAFLSKLLLLLFLGLTAVLIASLGFGLVFAAGSGNYEMGADFYLLASFLMWGSCIPLYIFHLYLALRLSKGLSMGLGIVESLVAALFLTGLGDLAWKYVPASWPAKIPPLLLQMYLGDAAAGTELYSVFPVYLPVTAAAVVLFIIWAGHWEGTKTAD